jgi:energy-coupling factor transporter ATP-binding protein EcfA2
MNAENIKKLQAIEIKPDGEIVTIAGKNGAGKSSVLDSIWWALAGTSHIQAEPIRKGQSKARIRLDMGEIVVERRFTEGGGSTLSVENAEGARFPSPQKMLDAFLGELSFDPLAFSRLEPRDQFDELRRVVQLEVDIDQLDGLNRSDYAKRTEVNRDAKAKRAQADGITFPAGHARGAGRRLGARRRAAARRRAQRADRAAQGAARGHCARSRGDRSDWRRRTSALDELRKRMDETQQRMATGRARADEIRKLLAMPHRCPSRSTSPPSARAWTRRRSRTCTWRSVRRR